MASVTIVQSLDRLRAQEDARAEVALAIDTAVAALLSTEYLSYSRRAEVGALLTKARLALEETA
jgi:hypothetical protein